MSPLKRQVPSHIERVGNILHRVCRKGDAKGRGESRFFIKWQHEDMDALPRSINLVGADVLEVRWPTVFLGEEVCARVELTGRAARTLGRVGAVIVGDVVVSDVAEPRKEW
jgi:hypothetical protein